MNPNRKLILSIFCLALPAVAEDSRGIIEPVKPHNHSPMVKDLTSHASDETQYDDGLGSSDNLRPGQRVEPDFFYPRRQEFRGRDRSG